MILTLLPVLTGLALLAVAPGYLQGMAKDPDGKYIIVGAGVARAAGQFLHPQDHQDQGITMSIFVVIAFFMVLMVAIAAFGYQRYARPGQVYERLGEPVIEAPTAGSPERRRSAQAARI